ncbi:MAG: flagellar brake protein [Lachnospiraceae bacterium]|nr:flagellar brake protein [Lachnospiraceae bacterium]
MLGKYVTSGDKVELHQIHRSDRPEKDVEERVYVSKINQVLDDDKLEIMMPIEGSKIVLLARYMVYNLVIYTSHGLYQCDVKVGERYKAGNIYLQQLDLITGIKKCQRREYYRYNCSIPVFTRRLEEEEKETLVWDDAITGIECNAIDIGGGGIRFLGKEQYQPEEMIICSMKLEIKNSEKEIQALGKVLSIKPVTDSDLFEIRVQFEQISNKAREQIIQYIFEDERKRRKKDSGL